MPEHKKDISSRPGRQIRPESMQCGPRLKNHRGAIRIQLSQPPRKPAPTQSLPFQLRKQRPPTAAPSPSLVALRPPLPVRIRPAAPGLACQGHGGTRDSGHDSRLRKAVQRMEARASGGLLHRVPVLV